MRKKYLIPLLSFFPVLIISQTGNIKIEVRDLISKKPIAAQVDTDSLSAAGEGYVLLENIAASTRDFKIKAEGYKPETLYGIQILPNQTLVFQVNLSKEEQELKELVIRRNTFKSTAESPVSLRTLTSEEVQKNAGSNRDISKAMLSLPGVGSIATFRNDLFIRGGSSSENKFYVDGIEVPIINHFQTQGASGGPRGLLTIDFIKNVDFYSGAFPAKRNGILSSLFEFNLKQARAKKLGYKIVAGLDDIQLMADGPISKDESWSGLISLRKSNLQLLFKAIGLPFLPSYYDSNVKISKKFQSGDELYLLFLGAIDDFKFNLDAKKTLENQTIIDRLPIAPQWNYTIGTGYRHAANNGNWLLVISRNMLDNKATKYYKNIEKPENLLLQYHSQEIENKIRFDRTFNINSFQFSAGSHLTFSKYYNNSIIKSVSQNALNFDAYDSQLDVFHYGLYGQMNSKVLDGKMDISIGLRTDAADYNSETRNIVNQISPRIAIRYPLKHGFAINMSAGIFHSLPPYTAFGYKENNIFINKNTLRYIQNSQLVIGTEYNLDSNIRFTLETYYKNYKNYPFSVRNQLSLANLGGDFGVIGNEPLRSDGTGKTYGIEFLAQTRSTQNYYGILAYTFGFSKFSNAIETLLPSAWDSRHILSLTGGKYLAKNWNIGARFRLQSGYPETPYDLGRSALVPVWNIKNGPVSNYNLLNTQRGNTVHQLDIRIEKKFIFKKWQATLYLDIVNAYGSQNPSSLPVVVLARDAQGNGIIENPSASVASQRYQLNTADSDRVRPLPYFGVILDF